MPRSTTRIQNLTLVTTLADGDVIPTGPASGDRAKGITFANLQSQIEVQDSEELVEITADTTLTDTVTNVVGFANAAVVLPDNPGKALRLRSLNGVTLTFTASVAIGSGITPLTSNQGIIIVKTSQGWEYIG